MVHVEAGHGRRGGGSVGTEEAPVDGSRSGHPRPRRSPGLLRGPRRLAVSLRALSGGSGPFSSSAPRQEFPGVEIDIVFNSSVSFASILGSGFP